MTEPRAVIFCHSTLTGRHFSDETRKELAKLLTELNRLGIATAVFSNDTVDVNAILRSLDLPSVDWILNRAMVGKGKGSPDWIHYLSGITDIPPQHMIYVGDDKRDQFTAINTPILYLQADWSNQLRSGVPSLVAERPLDILGFLSHFVTRPPRMGVSLDDESVGLHLRSVVPVGERLAGDTPSGTFDVRDIFTYDKKITVGGQSARDFLVLHAVSSLMLEAGIPPNPRITVYPSSKAGKLSPKLEEYLQPLSKTLHGFFKRDLLVRVHDARNTSQIRAQANRTGGTHDITIEEQMKSVCVGSEFRGKLRGKHVIVFDDFTTTGASLEWARNLLLAAGAQGVTLLTVGKYSSRHLVHTVREGVHINPYAVETRSMNEVFETSWRQSSTDQEAIRLLKESFDRQSKAIVRT